LVFRPTVVHAIDCDEEITKEMLEHQFDQNPNETATLVRSKGIHIHGHSMGSTKTKIY
jgi:hypothetical protein